ncbi:hypothetical protein F4604DRAFT_1926085 [Suillus subluteus]|nr:hypothetical protein F4604DRAFT_1926031 [Suillus subluteus]KAG1871700.1 hypothetical protein F4604DRAFT_1926085 [Suillus subluteus]
MSGSPNQKRLRRCFHVGSTITLNLNVHTHSTPDIDDLHNTDYTQFLLNNQVVHTGTQTAGKDEEAHSNMECELRRVKAQLKNAENNIAYLSERVNTYRYRWLEEYYCADNLERHMPGDIVIPELGQIPEGAASPVFFPEFFTWNEGGSEQGDI